MFAKTTSKAKTARSLLQWRLFRRRFRDHVSIIPPCDPGLPQTTNQETLLQEIIGLPGVASFLEVGIGPGANIDRMRKMGERGIRYVGCDYESVCESHLRQLETAGIPLNNITFRPNRRGTYAWTLMEMVGRQECFDVVYLDGHHTFYVDLPAAYLLDGLLRAGGYFLLDDVCWTLGFMVSKMVSDYHTWKFYHSIYDLDQYNSEQMELPHIGMIAKDILIGQLGYKRIDRYSTGYWWCLTKPQ
jgi:hypothetical protein